MFRTARSLVTEYTTSVSKGGCRIQAKKPLKVGTRFIFEMYARGTEAPVEIEGRVTWCAKSAEAGQYDIGIEYLPSEKRAALEKVLDEVFAEHQGEKTRLHPRIPVNLVAQDTTNPALKYLVRDLSRGGMGLRLPSEVELPRELKPRTLVMLAVRLPGEDPIEIGGEIAWIVHGRRGFTHSALGIAFVGIGVAQQETVDALTHLRRPAELLITFAPRG